MKRLAFIATLVVLAWWAMLCTRQFRAEVAQELGYFVIPGAVGAVWAWLIKSYFESLEQRAEAKKVDEALP